MTAPEVPTERAANVQRDATIQARADERGRGLVRLRVSLPTYVKMRKNESTGSAEFSLNEHEVKYNISTKWASKLIQCQMLFTGIHLAVEKNHCLII